MNRIDAHQHFWKFDPVRDTWINDSMKTIQKDFFPPDLQPVLERNGFDGCVAVQASQSESETDFLITLARAYNFIRGVVGWIDLQSVNVRERLAHYAKEPLVKGFRHVLQGEAQRDLMLQPNFKRGINVLSEFGFTYDILIFPDQIRFASQLVATFPDQRFVIDHIAKPYIKSRKVTGWKQDIEEIARYRNVYCKISGMVTEAHWHAWKKEDFKPYLDIVVNAFGTGRIMYGSDWPVCQVAAEYDDMVGIVKDYFAAFTKEEQSNFFGANAIHFYNL